VNGARPDRERKCVGTIGTVLVPLAGHFQCKHINIFFNKTYGSNFYRAMQCILGTSRGLCPSFCPSQVGVLLKRLNLESYKEHRTIAQGSSFLMPKIFREIRPRSPPTWAPNVGVVGQNRRLSINNRLYLENGKR